MSEREIELKDWQNNFLELECNKIVLNAPKNRGKDFVIAYKILNEIEHKNRINILLDCYSIYISFIKQIKKILEYKKSKLNIEGFYINDRNPVNPKEIVILYKNNTTKNINIYSSKTRTRGIFIDYFLVEDNYSFENYKELYNSVLATKMIIMVSKDISEIYDKICSQGFAIFTYNETCKTNLERNNIDIIEEQIDKTLNEYSNINNENNTTKTRESLLKILNDLIQLREKLKIR